MIADLTPVEVAERLRSPDPPLLLDVREDWEVRAATLPAAVHIPMNQVPQRLADLPSDRDVVVACHHGNRSRVVAHWLHAQGYSRVANMSGGVDEWSRTVDPDIPRY